MKKVIITEAQLDFIQKNQQFVKNNSLEIFKDEVKKFLYHLIIDDNESISDYWQINGIKKGDLYRMLKRYGVVVENETPETGDKIKVRKKNFDRKIDRLYYELFEDVEPGIIMTEDGEGVDGGTSCSSVGGSYETPLFGVQKRTFAN